MITQHKKTKKWLLHTRDGSRVLGTHDTYEKALKQERAIQISKRRRKNPPEKEVCARLPSYESALQFVKEPNFENTVKVVGSWVGRSAIISVGMGIAGYDLKTSVKNGLIAATAIEVFVLGHAIKDSKKIK